MRLVVIFETCSLEEKKSTDLTIGISGIWGSNFGKVVGSFYTYCRLFQLNICLA